MNNDILPFHPIANVFPMMGQDEITELQASISKNGLECPITLFEGMILDGRNRYAACVSGSLEPAFTDYTGSNAASYVLDLNLHRRHLTAGQKATVAVEILPHIEAERKLKQGTYSNAGGSGTLTKRPQSREIAAKLVGTGDKSVQQVRKIKKEAPELFEQLKQGKIAIKDAHREIKKKEHAKKIEASKSVKVDTKSKGPFDIILADPPWRYEFSSNKDRDIENHYPTLPYDSMFEHKPNSSKDSILFLWATSPKLLEALEVMKAWGFTYRSSAVWDKEIIGCGHWFRGQHEYLLVGVKGSPNCPPHSLRVSSVVKERRTAHSKKPQCVYEWIEQWYPDKLKLEMYCRSPRKNWVAWGNEI